MVCPCTVIAFGLLWAATLGGSLTVPIAFHSGPFDIAVATDGCFGTVFPAYVFSAYLISAVYDALLFLAVTYRLLFYHLYRDGQTSRLKSFFSGEGLGHVSKVLLQTGQSYYLCVPIHYPDSKTPLTYSFQADCGDEYIEHDHHIYPNIPSWSWHHRFRGALCSRDEYHGLHGLQTAEVGNIAERPMGSE